MKVLVTGGAGFLGSSLVEKLIEQGHKVAVVDDLSRGKASQVHPDAKLFIADASVEGSLDEALQWLGGLDLIHHLAAINGTKRFHEQADLVIKTNVNSTHVALSLAQEQNARVVVYSSPEAYGETNEMPLQSTTWSSFPPASLHQRHAYGASKYLDEVAAHHAVRVHGLDVRIVRPFNAYGPRLLGDEEGQVIAMMFARAMQGEPIIVHGDGSQTRSFTWIDDVIDGAYRAGQIDGCNGMSFNLGRPEEVSILDLANRIASLTKISVIHGEGYPGDSLRRLPDVATCQNLGWEASTSLDEGLKLMFNALQ
jgi:UDP-glucose 4-epimerase